MNFTLPDELLALQAKTRDFIAEQVIPLENDPRQDSHGPSDALRQDLVARARAAGLLTPHASREMGGLALSHVAKAIVFEEAGYSPLGPVALNIHAPDEGNIHLMDVVATEAQKDRWLRPLVQGHARSCFAMTEPAPGSGSDPSMLRTTAIRDGDDYLINGRKWLITGAEGADFGIVMARMEDGTATMFLTDMKRDGIIHERQLDSLDSCFTGGHGQLRFDNLRIPASDVLGEIGKGFRYAQVRLAPARLTHCMRARGAPGHSGSPCRSRARALDPLHALAGRRAPCPRHRLRLCAHPRCLRQAAGRAPGCGLHAGRQHDGPARGAPGGVALRLGARPGPAGQCRLQHGQGDQRRGVVAGGRSLRPGTGRARGDRGDRGGADLPRHSPVPHL